MSELQDLKNEVASVTDKLSDAKAKIRKDGTGNRIAKWSLLFSFIAAVASGTAGYMSGAVKAEFEENQLSFEYLKIAIPYFETYFESESSAVQTCQVLTQLAMAEDQTVSSQRVHGALLSLINHDNRIFGSDARNGIRIQDWCRLYIATSSEEINDLASKRVVSLGAYELSDCNGVSVAIRKLAPFTTDNYLPSLVAYNTGERLILAFSPKPDVISSVLNVARVLGIQATARITQAKEEDQEPSPRDSIYLGFWAGASALDATGYEKIENCDA